MSGLSYRDINERILRTLAFPRRTYYLLIGLCVTGILLGACCWAYQIATGMGVAGYRPPVM